MPPLYHKLPDQEYDVEKSELVKWLIRQPSIKKWLGSYLKSLSDYVQYDHETRKWVGVNYEKSESRKER